MKNKLIFTSFLSFMLISTTILGVSSCGETKNDNHIETIEITDALGRKVNAKKDNQRVLCIGASALRLYSYVGDMNKLCGVEAYETSEQDKVKIRPYNYAYRDLFKTLPQVKTGGPMQPANAEAILAAKPDIVFSLYNDVEKMDQLQAKINTPIVCLSYGKSDPFSNEVYNSLELIGKLVNTTARATEVISYIKNLKSDLNNRTKDIPESDKKKVFLGYNTYNGGAGEIGSSLVNYTCFKETNAKNVLTEDLNLGTNNPTIELEKLIELNPDIMFVDVANYSKLVADYKSDKKPSLEKISAFKNGEIYLQMPFNQYYTNIDIAMADCYFVGATVFKEQFKDINITEKYNEILSTLLNKNMNYYERTLKDTPNNLGFQKVDLATIK